MNELFHVIGGRKMTRNVYVKNKDGVKKIDINRSHDAHYLELNVKNLKTSERIDVFLTRTECIELIDKLNKCSKLVWGT